MLITGENLLTPQPQYMSLFSIIYLNFFKNRLFNDVYG